MKFLTLPTGVPCSAPGINSVFCRFAMDYSNQHDGVDESMIFEMGSGRLSHISELTLNAFKRDDFGTVNEHGEIDQ